MILPRKIIISRKGFDSTAGGFASPIIDGKLVSLPIPECKKDDCNHARYTELSNPLPDVTFAELFDGLKKRGSSFSADECVHLDPDIRPKLRGNLADKEAESTFCYGQDGGSQTELEDVTTGDLFLFFGWFREAERVNGTYRYRRGSQHKHILWGWLEVGKKIFLNKPVLKSYENDRKYSHHPHIRHNEPERKNNVLYEASPHLSFDPELAGSGIFENYHDELAFTKIGKYSRSTWRLPSFFSSIQLSRFTFPVGGDPELRWLVDGEGFIVPPKGCKGCGAASYGQEFVFSTEGAHGREIEAWLKRKFASVRS